MCEAEADCQASASAEANASLECTPPQLKVDYTFAAAIEGNLDAQAAFTARLSELKVRGTAILQGAAKYEALLTGKVNGREVFKPAPLAQLTASMSALANTTAIAKFDIPAGKLGCAVSGFVEAGRISSALVSGTTAKLQAQTNFVTAFTGGFS
jgi:hypothetical protein